MHNYPYQRNYGVLKCIESNTFHIQITSPSDIQLIDHHVYLIIESTTQMTVVAYIVHPVK